MKNYPRPFAITVFFVILLAAGGCPTQDTSRQTSSEIPVPSVGGYRGGTVASAPQDQDYGCDAPDDAASLEAQILTLVNQERSRRGLKTLAADNTLHLQASKYACELINGHFFAHVSEVTGSTLEDRADEFGYEYQVIGENLAAGQQTPTETMTAWMNSPGHAANILHEEFTEVGIAVRIGGDYGIYWVQEFGHPKASAGPRP